MNNILEIKSRFFQESSNQRPGWPKLAKGKYVDVNTLKKLKKDLEKVYYFWDENTLIDGALVSIHYCKIAAKSNRIESFLCPTKSTSPNECIVGAKYNNKKTKHIITYYVKRSTILETLDNINIAIDILNRRFDGYFTTEKFNNKKTFDSSMFNKKTMSRYFFQRLIVDSSYIDLITIEEKLIDYNENSVVTFYDVKKNLVEILREIGITKTTSNLLGNHTVFLNEREISILNEKAPYLVSMGVKDLTKIPPIDKSLIISGEAKIKEPNGEPFVGVIDTLFDENVYFNKWVTYESYIDPNIETTSEDKEHGTAVSSIIVDGHRLNPKLNDGCGYFQVKHFGVSLKGAYSAFRIVKNIKTIVAENPDITVWNLSLGSDKEIDENFISFVAHELDLLQEKYNCIFVVSGTNDHSHSLNKKVGSPADSINSIIVNSVNFKKEKASYSRKGPVLTFLTKPDVSYYGGDEEGINVVTGTGRYGIRGTSFAAPWISRKLAFLIHILGFSKEIAKALIIHSSIIENEHSYKDKVFLGHGVVPININSIVKTKSNQIRFIIEGTSEKYNTFHHGFPIPIYKGKYPFIAKATICYFPKTNRNQGVDYINTELDFYFGRVNELGKIVSINGNRQSIEDDKFSFYFEDEARKLYDKWNNVKHIQEKIKENNRARVAYSSRAWGMSIKRKERLNSKDGVNLRFGIVVTLEEINGVNRIGEFIKQFSLNHWIVNEINVDHKLTLFIKASEKIEFD